MLSPDGRAVLLFCDQEEEMHMYEAPTPMARQMAQMMGSDELPSPNGGRPTQLVPPMPGVAYAAAYAPHRLAEVTGGRCQRAQVAGQRELPPQLAPALPMFRMSIGYVQFRCTDGWGGIVGAMTGLPTSQAEPMLWVVQHVESLIYLP